MYSSQRDPEFHSTLVMKCRPMKLRPGDFGWVEWHQGEACEVKVEILGEGKLPCLLRVRDVEGSEHELPSWNVTRWEFEVMPGIWLREDDPLLWPYLVAAIESVHARECEHTSLAHRRELMQGAERILRRNGWPDALHAERDHSLHFVSV